MKDRYENIQSNDSHDVIHHQSKLKGYRYGLFGNACDNACGAIALYNVKNFLNYSVDLSSELKKASYRGTNLGLGILGTNPFFITRQLKRLREEFRSHMLPNKKKAQMIFENARIIVMMYRWGKWTNLHYAVFEPKEVIKTYNATQKVYKDFDELWKKEPIRSALVIWWI